MVTSAHARRAARDQALEHRGHGVCSSLGTFLPARESFARDVQYERTYEGGDAEQVRKKDRYINTKSGIRSGEEQNVRRRNVSVGTCAPCRRRLSLSA